MLRNCKALIPIGLFLFVGVAFYFLFWPRESSQKQENVTAAGNPIADTPDVEMRTVATNANSRSLPVVATVPTNPMRSAVAPAAKLSDMSAREVLNLAIQLAKDGKFLEAAPALAPYLARNWRDTLSFEEIAAMIADSSTPAQLRPFLTDFLIHATDLTADETERLSGILIAVAESSDADPELRKYALLAIRQVAPLDQTTRIREISENPEIPPEVRGAAITALRRTGNEAAHDAVVVEVMDQAGTIEPELLRSAVVSAAKAGIASNRVGQMREIAMTTESQDLFASTIYALGLVRTLDAVEAIVEASKRSGSEHIIRFALKNSQRVVLQMLAMDQPTNVVESGIQAARLAEVSAARPLLSILSNSYPEPEIRKMAQETIAVLPAFTELESTQQRKWED